MGSNQTFNVVNQAMLRLDDGEEIELRARLYKTVRGERVYTMKLSTASTIQLIKKSMMGGNR